MESLIGGDAANSVKNGSTESFQKDVIEASKTAPVIVDFWAPWCGPCRQLTPVLEKIAGQAGLTLVKINIDENQVLAGQMRIQSIPAVLAFFQGRPVDGFMGALPESEVKAFFARLAAAAGDPGDDVEAALAAAEAQLEAGDIGGAAQAFAHIAQADSGNARALAGLAQCHLRNGAPDRAREMLELAPPESRNDPHITRARAALELAEMSASDAGDLGALRAAVETDPQDQEARYALANALIAAGDREGGVDQLLAMVAADREWSEAAARKKLLMLFDAFGAKDPLTLEARRRLSSILFA